MVLLNKGKALEVRPESLDLHVPDPEPPSKRAKNSSTTLLDKLSKVQLSYPSDISFQKSRPSMFWLMSKSVSLLDVDLHKKSSTSLTEDVAIMCFMVFLFLLFFLKKIFIPLLIFLDLQPCQN